MARFPLPVKPVLKLSLSLIILIGGFFLQKNFLRVQSIECWLDGQTCPHNAYDQVQSLMNTQLLFFDHYKQANADLHAFNQYQLVSLHKKLPHTLIINLKTQPSLFQVHAQQDQTWWAVLPSGQTYMLEQQQSDLPVLEWAGESKALMTDDILHPNIKALTVPFFETLSATKLQYQIITLVDAGTIQVTLTSQLKALLDKNDPKGQTESLSLTLASLNLEDIDPGITEIDMRFDLPVLKKASSQSAQPKPSVEETNQSSESAETLN